MARSLYSLTGDLVDVHAGLDRLHHNLHATEDSPAMSELRKKVCSAAMTISNAIRELMLPALADGAVATHEQNQKCLEGDE